MAIWAQFKSSGFGMRLGLTKYHADTIHIKKRIITAFVEWLGLPLGDYEIRRKHLENQN